MSELKLLQLAQSIAWGCQFKKYGFSMTFLKFIHSIWNQLSEEKVAVLWRSQFDSIPQPYGYFDAVHQFEWHLTAGAGFDIFCERSNIWKKCVVKLTQIYRILPAWPQNIRWDKDENN